MQLFFHFPSRWLSREDTAHKLTDQDTTLYQLMTLKVQRVTCLCVFFKDIKSGRVASQVQNSCGISSKAWRKMGFCGTLIWSLVRHPSELICQLVEVYRLLCFLEGIFFVGFWSTRVLWKCSWILTSGPLTLYRDFLKTSPLVWSSKYVMRQYFWSICLHFLHHNNIYLLTKDRWTAGHPNVRETQCSIYIYLRAWEYAREITFSSLQSVSESIKLKPAKPR